MHDVLMTVSRNERRRLLADAERARRSGQWGEWERIDIPRGTIGRGWARDFAAAYRNRVFSVLVRDVGDGVQHMAVTSLSQERPSWYEMQRIKDEIAGEDRTAVEVYPPKSEIVDGADMFHIWVLRDPLPFSLHSRSS
jgi:hypothetical protein